MDINKKNNTLKQLKTLLFLLLLFILQNGVFAQQSDIQAVTTEERNLLVDSIAAIVTRYYIDPEVGAKIVKRVRTKNLKGQYSTITNPQVLADSLREDLRAINGDLHMSMVYSSPREIAGDDAPSEQVNRTGLWTNYGLSEIKVLEGNIGYLKIKHFTQHQYLEAIKPVITTAIESLKNTDALLLDVRDNGGGFEDMVAYYLSYFFDSETPIHLSDYRCTIHDHTYGISTDPDVLGTKLPDTKLYVLVNANTGSAAESFAYMLKHLERATIIGETTVGAGNGASQHGINNRFSIQVSSEETINAITKTSFEKVGVIPDLSTTSAEAFPTAYRLALKHAKEKNRGTIHPSNYDQVLSFIPPPTDTPINPKTYLPYLGVYIGGSTRITITFENNVLYGQMRANGGKMALTPLKEHTFKVGTIKERIRFVLDDDGNVIGLSGIDSPMELTKSHE
ncbi:S41 family peptidase [Maribacter sp.]|nr:S41 family peptidase [Maribacter sp.]